jgi:LytS/YehU family sensor histidine kinase
VLVVYFVQRRIKKVINTEKEKSELQNRWYVQEMRVLSAQMDPHFIFNSLNTIQQFIIAGDNEKAQSYLSKFSRLMRKILESNNKESVTLEEELEIFSKYLEIESLRFNNVFSYSIAIADQIQPGKIKIPHFLIQPFIENAIWHGLLPKEGEKILEISFQYINEKTLRCRINDNGVGRQNSGKMEVIEGKQSMAIKFIEQRLNLYSKMKNVKYQLKIVDNCNEKGESTGTLVEIDLPILV